MSNGIPKQSYDLYLDESGRPYIGEEKYRFFLVTALFMESGEKEMARSLLQVWKRKYLSNPDNSFHAVDFFEDIDDRKKNYRKIAPLNTRLFHQASRELYEITKWLKFTAQIYYVDLPKVRTNLKIFLENKSKETKRKIINTYTGGRPSLPLETTLKYSFLKHSKILSKKGLPGYVYFDSRREGDILVLETFHDCSINTTYGSQVSGVNLMTKRSLEPGLEIADLIAYCAMQNLRGRFSRKEVGNIREWRLKAIRMIWKELNRKRNGNAKIKVSDMTSKTKKN